MRGTFITAWRLARQDNSYTCFGLMLVISVVWLFQLALFLMSCLALAPVFTVVCSLAGLLMSTYFFHEMLANADAFAIRMAEIDRDHELTMKKLREDHAERMAYLRGIAH